MTSFVGLVAGAINLHPGDVTQHLQSVLVRGSQRHRALAISGS